MYNILIPYNNDNFKNPNYSGIRYGKDGGIDRDYIQNNLEELLMDISPTMRGAPNNMLP